MWNLDEMEGLERAVNAIAQADALLVGAGAGMSVDAGIPAFRLNPTDEHGRPSPALGGMSPLLFREAPSLAWGRAGQRLSLFRSTEPHRGYEILRRWASTRSSFVMTSNVDGLFSKAGFVREQVLEGHGSMHHGQCSGPCNHRIWPLDWTPNLADGSEYAESPLPQCPDCGKPARPNVFMFGDTSFNEGRVQEQVRSFDAWLAALGDRRLAIVECGAGTAVPTIRRKCEAYAARQKAPLIRINLHEATSNDDTTIVLRTTALDGLGAIDTALADASLGATPGH